MGILVVAEHDNDALKPATLNTVATGGELGGELGEVSVLVAGAECRAVAEAAAKVAGVANVLLADAEIYAHPLAESLAPLVAGLASAYSHLLAPAAFSSGEST